MTPQQPSHKDLILLGHNGALSVIYKSVQALARFAQARHTQPDSLLKLFSKKDLPHGRPLALNSNHLNGHVSSKEARPSTHWDLYAGWEGTLEMAKTGWQDGAKDLKTATLRGIHHSEEKTRLCFSDDVSGAFPVIPAFLSGRPDCLKRLSKKHKPQPIINLLVPQGVAAEVSSRDLLKRGRALVRLINDLESSGFLVGLLVGECQIQPRGKEFNTLVHLKHHNETTGLGSIAFALAHPSFDRRLGFASLEIFRNDLHGGYGQAKNLHFNPDHPVHKHLPNLVTLPHYYQRKHFAKRTEDDFYKEALAEIRKNNP